MSFGPILRRSFYERPTIEVARSLLGKVLVHGPTAGLIVETEAYLGGDDLAAHSARGITDRTRVIFGPPGHAYIYLIYGMYECLNLVCEPEGQPGCVLIRALEPLAGVEIMRRRRPAAHTPQDLASGPGKLTLAMAITRAQNGVDVTRGSLAVREATERRQTPEHRPASQDRQTPDRRHPPDRRPPEGRQPPEDPQPPQHRELDIAVTPRIGITQCADLPLRFFIRGNPHVSRSRKDNSS